MSALRVKSGTAKQKEGSGTTAAAPSESYVLASRTDPIKADQSDYDGK
jgi:hypothetical protein